MFSKLFGKKSKLDRYEELADQLYQVLVDEPPSSADDEAIDHIKLKIKPNQLVDFSHKRTLLLETLFFVSAMSSGGGHPNPLGQSVRKLLKAKSIERGMRLEVIDSQRELQIDEVEQLFTKPIKWSEAWTDEFYSNDETCPCTLGWAKQVKAEFDAMSSMFEKYADY